MQRRVEKIRMKSPIMGITTLMALVIFLIAGCDSLLKPQNETKSTPTATVLSQTDTLAPTVTAEPVTPIPGAKTIVLWVPPQFNPASGTAAGDLLQKRLNQFMEVNPGTLVETRVKGASGPGGLLDSLTTSSIAAPGAMPSVVALSRTDLEQAALKSLILSLDGLTPATKDNDLYPYAQDLGRIQTSTFGIPFAGDALILVYRTADLDTKPPTRWSDIYASRKVMIASLDDDQACLTMALYRSAKGSVQDKEGRPKLDAKILTQALTVYSTGISRGNFPAWLTQLQTTDQAWQAFTDNQGSMVVTWSSNFLADMPQDANAAALPSLGDPYTLMTGWSWALTDRNPETRELSVKLIEFLSEDDFLAEWTAAAGYLPTKPSILRIWPNASLQSVFDPILTSAEVRPANELTASLGPVMHEAVFSIFNGQASPEQAAQSASEKLGAP